MLLCLNEFAIYKTISSHLKQILKHTLKNLQQTTMLNQM